MSTENEGAAVPPAAGPDPTPPAPADAPSTGAPAGGGAGADSGVPAAPSAPAGPAASETSAAASPAAPADAPAAAADTADAASPAQAAPPATSEAPAPAADSASASGSASGSVSGSAPGSAAGHGGEPAGRAEDTAVLEPRQETPAAPPPQQPPHPAGYGQGPAQGPDLHKPPQTPPGGGMPPQGGAPGGWGWGAPGGSGYGQAPPPPPYGGGGSDGGPPNPWAMPPAGPPPGKRRGGLFAAFVTTAVVVGGVAGGLGYWAANKGDGGTTTVSSSTDPKTLNRSPKSVAGIAAKAVPSVVTLQSSGGGEEGTGTGFVYDKEGHILTNNHVVANSTRGGRLTATFSDGKKYQAKVVGEAQGYDIAVLKLKGADDRKLEPLPLANSNEVAVGDATIAIGAPFGLSGTVTTGIVSAKNRPVASSDGQGSKASYMSALQTDASINPGNSGGPLLDGKGAVIGVNSAIQPGGGGGGMGGGGQSGGSVGLGFAIPINQAKRVAGQLIKTGQPVYPMIGATVEMGGNGNGATVARTGEGGTDEAVTPGGPADKAGLKPGDVITKLDDTVIDSGPTLIGTIWTHSPGEKVQITFERGGDERKVEVTLGTRKGDDQ